ncbi:MAG: DUF1127 domain-containing protein [Pseudomonadota bacterium]
MRDYDQTENTRIVEQGSVLDTLRDLFTQPLGLGGQHELGALNDHLLRDIGMRRDQLDQPFDRLRGNR